MSDWHALGDVNYRVWPLYETMGWRLPVGMAWSDCELRGAKFGGPMALFAKQGSPSSSSSSTRGVIGMVPPRGDRASGEGRPAAAAQAVYIYTASGVVQGKIDMENGRNVVDVGWTDTENLMVLCDDGHLLLHDSLGSMLGTKILLIDDVVDASIAEVRFWGDGAVALTSDMRLWVLEGVAGIERGKTSHACLSKSRFSSGQWQDRHYTCMAIIPPHLTRLGTVEVVLCTSDCSIVVVDKSGPEDQLLSDRLPSPVMRLDFAPSGRFAACFRSDGTVTVLSSSFTQKILDFDTQSPMTPNILAWCGQDAMVVHWNESDILIVGPYGDWLNIPYSSKLFVLPEDDCCRIITPTSCDVIQRVPAAVEAIERIGSTHPAALLTAANEAFEEGETSSDENIRSLVESGQLAGAVTGCISAAAAEFDVARQQTFLRAASYGKAFCDPTVLNPAQFVLTAQRLRVLNHLAKPEVGVPLTFSEFDLLGLDRLLQRLSFRHLHFLALKICSLLEVDCTAVLTDWAIAKVRTLANKGTHSPVDMYNAIHGQMRRAAEIVKLRPGQVLPYFSSIAVAEAAFQSDLAELAELVLDAPNGPSPDKQVPLLLRVGAGNVALRKAMEAMESGDTDLVFLTLIELAKADASAADASSQIASNLRKSFAAAGSGVDSHGGSLPSASASSSSSSSQLLSTVLAEPRAVNLLRLYYLTRTDMRDQSALHNLLIGANLHVQAAVQLVGQAHRQPILAQRLHFVHEAAQVLRNVGKGDGGASVGRRASLTPGFVAGAQGDPSTTALRTSLDDEEALLDMQHELENRTSRGFVNLSVAGTVYKLIQLSYMDPTQATTMEAHISTVVKRFKMSEKQIWMLRIQAYANDGQWALLWRLADEKKNPVGFRPFALAAIRHNQPASELGKYVERITPVEERLDIAMDQKLWDCAVDAAVKLRDANALETIARRCHDEDLQTEISRSLAKL